jgi:hypothetical protein
LRGEIRLSQKSPRQRTLHVQHESEVVKGGHAQGVVAMRRGEASEVEKLFFVVVGNRATIGARSFSEYCKFFKIEISNFSQIAIWNFAEIKFANSARSRTQKLSARDRAKPQRGIKPRRTPGGLTIAVSTTSFVHPAVYRVPACITRLYAPSLCILLYEEIDLAVQLVGRMSVPTRSISY